MRASPSSAATTSRRRRSSQPGPTQRPKARWFSGPEEWEVAPHQLDFRVGGREVGRGGPKGGPVHTYRATYWDIVPNERIVYTYEMLMDETRVSVSLATVELKPEGGRTLLTLTEHGALFDGLDSPNQRQRAPARS